MDGKHSRTTSGVTSHHRRWTAHTVERHWAWHAIIDFGQHTRLKDVGRGMPSSPLGSTYDRTTSGVACHHSPWTANTMNDIGHGMPSTPFDSTHGRTTSGLTCHHRLWTSHTVEQRRAWHAITALGVAGTVRWRRAWYAIIALGWQTRSNDVGRGMSSPPLDSTHGRTTSGVASHHRLWEA